MATIADFVDKEQNEGVQLLNEPEQMEVEAQPVAARGFDLSFLKAQTGPGQIEEYQEHALNFNGSKAVARIIRGLTGLLGELNFAVVDVLLGVLELAKDRKKGVIANVGH